MFNFSAVYLTFIFAADPGDIYAANWHGETCKSKFLELTRV